MRGAPHGASMSRGAWFTHVQNELGVLLIVLVQLSSRASRVRARSAEEISFTVGQWRGKVCRPQDQPV